MQNTLDNETKRAILQRVHSELMQGKTQIDWQTQFMMTEQNYAKHIQRVKKTMMKFGSIGLIVALIYLTVFMSYSPMIVGISLLGTILISLIIMWLVSAMIRKQAVGQLGMEHIRLNMDTQKIEWLGHNQRVVYAQKFHTHAEIHAFSLPDNAQAQDIELQNKIQNIISHKAGVRFMNL